MKTINIFLPKTLLTLCFFALQSLAYAHDFSVSKIPLELLKDANAVIRLDEETFEILSKSEAKQRNRLVVTILNEKGEDTYSEMMVRHDKFTKITDLAANIYDADGKLIRKIKSSDIKEFGYGIVGNDITDARFKVVDFGRKSYPYPYSIELSYDTRDRNMMSYPSWVPTNNGRSSIEYSSFKIKTPIGFTFRYKEYNGASPVKKTFDTDGLPLYEWTMRNHAVLDKTPYPLPENEFLPRVLTAPVAFEIQEYSGVLNNWEDFSKFYYTLNKDRDQMPAETIAEIKSVVKDARTDREKVLLLYKWLQARSRYVSIQLGIGGWQTIDAMTVAAKGYGDCKALSNFMAASLKQVGITSYVALIKAGDEAENNLDFPSNQFNHVIACAILPKDTIWLECTSQNTSAGFMGSFTGNRKALLVMPEGGKLVTTHFYESEENVVNRVINAKLDEKGNGQLSVRTNFKGMQQEARERLLYVYTKEEQKKWLLSNLELPNMELENIEYSKTDNEVPVVTEKLRILVRNCATRTGDRLFVKPNLLTRQLALPNSSKEQTTDFYLPPSDYNFTDSDSVSFEIPAGLKLETSLPNLKIESVFGIYTVKVEFDNNRLFYLRNVTMKGGRFSSADYPKWIDFLKKIRKADRSQIVFVESKT
ncbi:DUF3857 domain-containing transglutaminase family protein [Dyadobacter sp. CY345]|uniref:DUF3857 domain-containing protein n=1 Tax=Dyadobacter sp. CY345 TaxID=2909335 RepID=UPI001F249708|nr:DUF3857 domain-containing transglutaminase family protein [Dyadobacter sp. CY345]MCF2445481.1 DUF3857 domain-containing transglutaminase family protein [Dyadobacter sp. CY345]